MAPASSNKRKHDEVDDNNIEEKVTPYDVLESQLEKVKPLLCPPNDKAFSTQMNYLNTYIGTIDKSMLSATLSWEDIARTISYFLSYHMIRRIHGEDAEGLRSAARAMYNLVYQLSPLIKSNNDERDRLFEYTRVLASYPYEIIYDLQSLWDTFYWEKKEDVYQYLKKSKFELQPGDSFTKPSADGTEEIVTIKESDMILTKGDINKMSPVTMYLALARATRVLFRDRGLGSSTRKLNVRGEYRYIYIGPKHRCKEEGVELLEDYRVTYRKYEKLLVDEFGGRIQIERVEKDGWWMRTEGSWGATNSVFVPLTAKVAKMGLVGTVFSGMRLGLAGGLWRPLPSEQQIQPMICYNVYPPSFDNFETESEKKNARNERTENNGNTEEGKTSEEDGSKDLTVDGVEEEGDVVLPVSLADNSIPVSDATVGTAVAEPKEEPSDAEFHALIDILFASATKDKCTIGEMNRSIATYYGWEEIDKERKKKIKKRLLDLVSGQCEQVRLSDLVSARGAGDNDESNTK